MNIMAQSKNILCDYGQQNIVQVCWTVECRLTIFRRVGLETLRWELMTVYIQKAECCCTACTNFK